MTLKSEKVIRNLALDLYEMAHDFGENRPILCRDWANRYQKDPRTWERFLRRLRDSPFPSRIQRYFYAEGGSGKDKALYLEIGTKVEVSKILDNWATEKVERKAARPPRGARARKGGKSREDKNRETRESLVRAARELFSRFGDDNVSIREICAYAGQSSSQVNYHFGSAQKFLEAV